MAKSSTLTDPTRRKPLPEIREDYEYAKTGWASVRDAAADDMQNVNGNPWSDDDLDVRENRPTIAPDEMTQYRNQVTNGLRREPRGIKFQPRGMGASQKTAELYQDKVREVEYRSDAAEHYIISAENVLQRSYGAFRVGIRYENPRDVNPELYIDGFPDPDVVLPDPDIRREHGQDMKFAFVLETMRQSDFKRKFPGAEIRNFAEYIGRSRFGDWLIGSKSIQIAEYWKVESEKRKLYNVVLGAADVDPREAAAAGKSKPMALFEDELENIMEKGRGRVRLDAKRFVRDVDYPKVVMRITNGLEVLETKPWPGRYIPIVLLFGPVLYVKEGGETKRYVNSMTRTMKGPWKAFCYACSQELEVLGQVPKAAAVAYEGQLAGHEDEWEESLHVPKAFLYAKGRTAGMDQTEERLPLPQRMEYTQASYLQAIEVVKEGYRRSIQAAAGSNFLPTQAQRQNEKSGVALDKMEDSRQQGTYHFAKTYESAIEWGGVIMEDLFGHVYDFTGEVGVMNRKMEAASVKINDPDDEEAFPTRGDHLVTVQTMPMSDSEYDAVEKFINLMVGSLQMIAQVSGAPAAAYVLSQSIKMRNLGPMGDELADVLLPQQFQSKDGKPPDPRLAQATQEIQKLTQELQAASKYIKEKVAEKEVEMKAKIQEAEINADRDMALQVMKNAAEIAKAHIAASTKGAALNAHAAEEAAALGQDANEFAKDRIHDLNLAVVDQKNAMEQAEHDAALVPPETEPIL